MCEFDHVTRLLGYDVQLHRKASEPGNWASKEVEIDTDDTFLAALATCDQGRTSPDPGVVAQIRARSAPAVMRRFV
jgi:hypothetical protein